MQYLGYIIANRVSRPRQSAVSYLGGFVFFVLAIGLIIVIFSIDYTVLAKRVSAFSDPDGFAQVERVPQSWLARYELQSATENDFTSDTDNDGLTLEQEYQYLTNPLIADTDGDGVSDGQEVAEGSNPRGVGVLDTDGDGMTDTWERDNGLDVTRNDRREDPDGDELSNWQEFRHQTDPQNPDTDGDLYTDGDELSRGFDPSAPGEDAKTKVTVSISKIDIIVPMVWAQSILERDMQEYLKKGAIHYPRTAAPGQPGNMFISAHSSNYAWVEGNFNAVFSKLNELVPGDIIKITQTLANGAKLEYLYKATQNRIVQPDDPWIFMPTTKSTLTLSTCWPLNTRQKRMIVKAVLL